MRKEKRWAVSSSGPDEIDVETMMRAMGALHSGVVMVAISPVGIGSSGGVRTIAEIAFTVVPGSDLPGVVGTVGMWPCASCKSFYGHLYHQLHELDREIARVYKQQALWE